MKNIFSEMYFESTASVLTAKIANNNLLTSDLIVFSLHNQENIAVRHEHLASWANVSGEFWELQSQYNCRMLACIAETVLFLLEGMWLIAFYEGFFLLRALNHSTVVLN